MLRTQSGPLIADVAVALSGRVASYSNCTERLWDKLSRNPSVFGRLLSIAEMWNAEKSRYESPLSVEFGQELVDRAVREIHQEVFGTWLNFRLQQQERDLTVWLASLNHNVANGLQTLQAVSKRLDRLLPPHHTEAESQLFVQDFQLVSTMVRWTDVEAGLWCWPAIIDEHPKAENPTIGGRMRAWVKQLRRQ
jgi:hypothetical protein